LSVTSDSTTVGEGNAFVSNSSGLSLSASNVDVTNTFDLSAAGTITTSGAGNVSAGDVNLTTTTGNISLTAGAGVAATNTLNLSSAGTIVLGASANAAGGSATLSASGDITGASTVGGTSVSLTSTSGNIGASGSAINTATTGTLSVTSDSATLGEGNAFVSNSTGLSVDAANVTVTNTFDLTAAGTITTSGAGTISAGTLAFTASAGDVVVAAGAGMSTTAGDIDLTSSAGAITVSAAVSAATDITFGASTTITTSGVGTVAGDNVTLTTSSASINLNAGVTASSTVDITSAADISIGATTTGTTSLTATAQGSFIQNGGGTFAGSDVTLDAVGGSIGTTGSAINTAASTLTLTGATDVMVFQAGSVSLETSSAGGANTFDLVTTGAGSVAIDGGVTAGTINLTAGGAGDITKTSGSLAGTDINLASGTGNVGTSTLAADRIDTTATGMLTVNTGGNAFVREAGDANLGLSSAGALGTFDLLTTASGAIDVAGGISGGTVNLTANGAGDISTSLGVIDGTNVNLASTSGNIGTGAGSRVDTIVGTLTANTDGDVFLTANNGVTNLVTVDSSAAGTGRAFDLTSAGLTSVAVTGDVSAGNISFAATGTGNVTASLGANSITADTGEINLFSAGGSGNIDSGTLIAMTNINLTGETAVSVGTAGDVALSAGALIAGDPLNTDINSYQTDNILSSGNINVITTTSTSNITFSGANDTTMLSIGGDVNITSGQNVDLSTTTTLFAQAGNVIVNASDGTNTLPDGTTITTVARYVTGGGTVTIDGQTVQAFQGGGLAIWAGPEPVGGLSAYLDTLQLARVNTISGGTVSTSGIVNLAPGTVTTTIGGGSIIFASGIKGSINVTGISTFVADGSVLLIDPVGPINMNNVNFQAFGPQIGFVPPVPPTPSPIPSPTTTFVPTTFVTPTIPSIGGTPTVISTDQTTTQSMGQINSGPNTKQQPLQPINLDTNDGSQQSNTWFIALGSCQPFAFEGSEGTSIIGAGGTTFAPSGQHTILLKEGKMVATAGRAGLVIETVHGNVQIPADASVIVEQKANGVVRVDNLAGGDTNMTLTKGNENKVLTAQVGQEVIVADEALSDEELIPVDGVDREPVTGALAVSGVKVRKNKYNREMMAEREVLLRCDMGPFVVWMKKRMNDLRDNMSGVATAPAKPNNLKASLPANTNAKPGGKGSKAIQEAQVPPEFQQIAYNPSDDLNVSFATGIMTLATQTALFKHAGSTQLVMENQPGLFTLKKGETLVWALKPTFVRSGDYTISIKSGAIALVSREGKILKVRNIYEASTNSIWAIAGGKCVKFSAGQEVCLGPTSEELVEVLKDDPIGRRRLNNIDIGNGCTLTRCEVSLVSLAQHTDLLSKLISSDKVSDRDITAKLLKMAACLSFVTQSHGPYAQVSP
jgi:hypothetical protein